MGKLRVPVTTPATEALQAIYKEIGCEGVKEKHLPNINIQFSKDPKRIRYQFSHDHHWEDLRTEWILEVHKKKQAATADVLLDDDVSSTSYPPFFQANLVVITSISNNLGSRGRSRLLKLRGRLIMESLKT